MADAYKSYRTALLFYCKYEGCLKVSSRKPSHSIDNGGFFPDSPQTPLADQSLSQTCCSLIKNTINQVYRLHKIDLSCIYKLIIEDKTVANHKYCIMQIIFELSQCTTQISWPFFS